MNKENAVKLAFVFLTSGVILGAFGAHALKSKLNPEQLEAYKTGVLYQFIHALGLLIIAQNANMFKARGQNIGMMFLASGIVLFSGSIYLLTTLASNEGLKSILGPITPVGGLSFILGWIILLFSVKKSRL